MHNFCRQLRALWFTCQREYWKCKASKNHMRKEGEQKRQKYEEKLKEEETLTMFLSAISTLMEDAPQITLLVYIILRRDEQDTLGQCKLDHCRCRIVTARLHVLLRTVLPTPFCLSVCQTCALSQNEKNSYTV